MIDRLSCWFLFLILSATGCVVPESDLDFNPLYRSMVHEGLDRSDGDTVLPFYYSRLAGEDLEWGLRPLITCSTYDGGTKKDCDFIPPLGKYTDDGQRSKLRFWPLFWYTRTDYPGQGEDLDWIFFPLLWGGHSDSGENYFAFFPLGGVIYDFLAYEKFEFILWPLYQRVTTEKLIHPPCVSTNFLLLFGWTEGGLRDGSFQVLPFYLKRVYENKYRKYSVLWPFLHYQESGLDTDNPATLYAFWPLFVFEQSAIHYRFGLIGPFFFAGPLIQASRRTPPKWEGKPNTEGHAYYLYDLPWPLVRIEKNKEFELLRLLPFYSHFSQPGFDSKAFLVPFFWHRKEWNEVYEKDDLFFVPFFHSSSKSYRQGGEDGYLQLWPLFHNETFADGQQDFSVLSLLPLRRENYVSGLDKVLWPFWNLYRYRADALGASRHDALFGLVTAYDDPFETRFSLPLLYNYSRIDSVGWEHNFLFNLFCFGGDEEGLKKLRILFIPFMDS